ncbi:MAG: Cytochrome c biogenesis factor CcmF [Candidatus Methanohalarchaeum thermophilum]|uniref:Cytochrome c biogenesis factor CcmF n=1 Tax=Methanohalarchaeum thermophilum TaxID=1903181 RepID=A0A1Q6DXJ7_METT1|nr:MAG: Cytochrome c biogenesis factor CcmF [Candidatus Methanohalarchaeum thermophilum]
MRFGEVFLWLTFFSALIAIYFSFKSFRNSSGSFIEVSRKTTFLTFLMASFSFFSFSISCFLSDSSLFYSYAHSLPSYPWYFKLSSIWAGQSGSFFLWFYVIISLLLLIEFRWPKEFRETDFFSVTKLSVLFIFVSFVLLLISTDAFRTTEQALRNFALQNPDISNSAQISTLKMYYPRGWMMNSMLLSPWMVIHPPIIFVGYAAFTIPLASTFGFAVTGSGDWSRLSKVWSRVGWFFLSLGIGIGAYWAYVTLGWGGYWGWDPVESSSLLPWLTATAFLHLQIWYIKTNKFRCLAHIFSLITFILVIFATFVTRGGLNLSSVHSFAQLAKPTFLVLITLLIGVSGTGSILLWLRMKREKK